MKEIRIEIKIIEGDNNLAIAFYKNEKPINWYELSYDEKVRVINSLGGAHNLFYSSMK